MTSFGGISHNELQYYLWSFYGLHGKIHLRPCVKQDLLRIEAFRNWGCFTTSVTVSYNRRKSVQMSWWRFTDRGRDEHTTSTRFFFNIVKDAWNENMDSDMVMRESSMLISHNPYRSCHNNECFSGQYITSITRVLKFNMKPQDLLSW
jgi:hypothetical protein